MKICYETTTTISPSTVVLAMGNENETGDQVSPEKERVIKFPAVYATGQWREPDWQAWIHNGVDLLNKDKKGILSRWLAYTFVSEPGRAIDQNEALDRYHEEFGPFTYDHPLMWPEEFTTLILQTYKGSQVAEIDDRLVVEGVRWVTLEERKWRAHFRHDPAKTAQIDAILSSTETLAIEGQSAVPTQKADVTGATRPKGPRAALVEAEKAIAHDNQKKFKRLADKGLIDRPRTNSPRNSADNRFSASHTSKTMTAI